MENDESGEASERRELERLQQLARQSMEALGVLRVALSNALATNSVYVARSHLRGTGHTFSMACMRLLELV